MPWFNLHRSRKDGSVYSANQCQYSSARGISEAQVGVVDNGRIVWDLGWFLSVSRIPLHALSGGTSVDRYRHVQYDVGGDEQSTFDEFGVLPALQFYRLNGLLVALGAMIALGGSWVYIRQGRSWWLMVALIGFILWSHNNFLSYSAMMSV